MDETASGGLGGWIVWILTEMGMGFYHILEGLLTLIMSLVLLIPGVSGALTDPDADTGPPGIFRWLAWDNSTEAKQSLMQFIYYGGSTEFFFIVFNVFLVITVIGVINNRFLWNVVIGLEFFGNWVGRFFAWAGLLMVIQQVVIVIMQRIFTRPDIVIGFGIPLDFDISWYAEELKLYNAMVVCLCLAYTFIQGGHVRVDLVYSAVSHRTKRIIDMVGCMIFMVPMAVLCWLYTWFFMWRHLINPPVSASDTVDRMLLKARATKWSVETIGFSPNGFNAYFLFKVLMVIMLAMIFIQAWAFFYRSYLEYVEGEESAGKNLDKDVLEQGEEPYDHADF